MHRAALWLAYRVLLATWFVFRPRRRGVLIAVWHGGRVLAIRNSYRPWIGLPAGGVKRGETSLAAAVRELREEVGIVARPEALRFACEIPSSYEFKRDRCAFFEIELAEPPAFQPDQREVIWAGFLSAEQALREPLAPPVRVYLEGRLAGRER